MLRHPSKSRLFSGQSNRTTMSEKAEHPIVFSDEIESQIQKISEHTGLTRDEVVQSLIASFFDLVDQSSDDVPAFALIVRRALRESEAAG